MRPVGLPVWARGRWLGPPMVWLALGLATLGVSMDADALTIAAMSLGEITDAASLVVRARCIDRQVSRSDGRVDSLARFVVLERVKGDAPEVVTVRELGGVDGDIEVSVPGAPRSEPGDEVVLFLEPSDREGLHVVGLAQGYFRVMAVPGGPAAVVLPSMLDVKLAPGGGLRPVRSLLDRVRTLAGGER